MRSQTDPGALLALLQIADSAFPSGSFTHSYGLEQLVREGGVRDAADVERYVTSVLTHSIATADAPAAFAAALAARVHDLRSVVHIDRALHASKAACELRNASLQTGRRLLEEVALHVEDDVLAEYRAQVVTDERLGAYPVAFGVVAAALNVSASDVPAVLMQTTANAMLHAAMRLTRFSHRDIQAALHRLRPQITALAAEVQQAGAPVRLIAFHLVQEIASMRHERAEARLFAS